MKRFAWALLCLIPLVAAAQNSLDGRRFDTQAGFTGKPAHIANGQAVRWSDVGSCVRVHGWLLQCLSSVGLNGRSKNV